MRQTIDTRQPSLVEEEVKADYRAMFPEGNVDFITQIFDWFESWFGGNYRDFQRIDAHYHDMEHTLQGELCMTAVLRGYHDHGPEPALTQRMYELGMLAMLLHDTGYLKKRGDQEGTGAKYTLTHVDRSIEFAGELMLSRDFAVDEILAVQNMIRCTGVNVKLETIQFQNPIERIVGFALGAADLLGQMAAHDYIDKLPILYSEFAEAAAFGDSKMRAGGFFSSADDLMQKTPLFWEKYVLQKINRDFLGLYRYLNDPYPDGPNPYIQQIEANMLRLHRDLAHRNKR